MLASTNHHGHWHAKCPQARGRHPDGDRDSAKKGARGGHGDPDPDRMRPTATHGDIIRGWRCAAPLLIPSGAVIPLDPAQSPARKRAPAGMCRSCRVATATTRHWSGARASCSYSLGWPIVPVYELLTGLFVLIVERQIDRRPQFLLVLNGTF